MTNDVIRPSIGLPVPEYVYSFYTCWKFPVTAHRLSFYSRESFLRH